MRKFILTISCLLFCAVITIAQDNTKTKNNKAEIYDNLYEIYQLASLHRSDSTCLHYCDSMRTLARKQGDLRAEAMSWAFPLSYYMNKKQEEQFYTAVDSLMTASEKAELWSFYYHAISQESIYLLRQDKYAETISLAEKTLKKAYKDNNKNGIYASHYILANCYQGLRLYDKAAEQALDAIKAEIGLPDNEFGNSLLKLAEAYYEKHDWKACLDALNKFEFLVENDRVRVRIVEYKAVCYYWLGDTKSYKQYCDEAKLIYEKLGRSTSNILGYTLEGIDLMNQGRFTEAEKVFKSLGRPDSYYYLSELYKRKEDTDGMAVMRDSLSNDWAKMVNSLYNADVKKYDLEVENQVLQQKRKFGFIIGIITLLVVLLMSALALYLSNRRRKKQLEAQLLEVRKANNANAAKTAFLFNMSHDIRTPMNAIMGFTDLIEKHYGDEEKCMDYIHKTQAANKFLLSLINNVLEMARIESGNISVSDNCGDAVKFVDTVCSVFQAQMEEKNIRFTHSIYVKHPYIHCDTVKIRAIILNILSNAYKYTPEGGTVTYTLTELPSDKDGFALYQSTVTDTGIGMSSEFLPHIFEEFSRAKSATESGIEGTGLGMPIVKRYVELMGGTINVESAVGKGSTFTVKIYHKIADKSELDDEAAETNIIADFSGKRILMAEDNDLNAEIAEEILTEAGFSVERAKDGAECVNMLKDNQAGYYDIILMDVQMPNMNGYEATRTIRSLDDPMRSGILIIAMTANAFESDIKDAMDAGMNGHISKPIEVSKLLKMLSEKLTVK